MGTGIVYGGLNRFSLSAYDSSTTQFTYIYSDGGAGWTEAGSNVIDFAHYDDGDGTLGNVDNNKYSVHYVYKHIDDEDVYVVYGTGSYTLAEAEVQAIIPPTTPDHLTDFGCQIGAIIAPQAGGSFASVIMVTSQFFSGTEVVNHNNLGGLQGGTVSEYYHLTSAQHTNNAYTTDKLSAFAATTSAELAGVISDEIGTGKARFDTSVTTFTGTDTIDVSEAGTILVSASSPYTLTLPTPVDNIGLTYKFKKTDFNYNLITVATTAGQFNYENADSALKDTYPRLNTGGAEATFVSDGTNWQVMDEALGQVPSFRMDMVADQSDLPQNQYIPVILDDERYDTGDNFDDSTWVSGNATATSTGHLIDSGGSFTADMVWYRVKNTTDETYTYITAYNSATDVTVKDDIFVDTEGYEIKHSKFVAPVNGNYLLHGNITYSYAGLVLDKAYMVTFYKNDTRIYKKSLMPGDTQDFAVTVTFTENISKDDILTMRAHQRSGTDNIDISINGTTFLLRLISKE